MLERSHNQREEVRDSLQLRIEREKAILQRRLTWQEPPKRKKRSTAPRSHRPRRAGRLYEVFQALGEDE